VVWLEGKKILALCGGVGGAKLALGLTHVLPPEQLSLAVNTGDDFTHLGLSISPDLDTVIYTLAGIGDTSSGWGRGAEQWLCMETLQQLGADSWFQLGDKDLGLHLFRSELLRRGLNLSEVTAKICEKFSVRHPVFPMSDDPVATLIDTEEGLLPFQHYFVKQQCRPRVTDIRFDGAERSAISPGLAQALVDPELGGVIICPSNPYLSIDPMLALPEMRAALADLPVPVLAVAPLVGGAAIKGPTAKIMAELGVAATTQSVAQHYADFLTAYVLDEQDQGEEFPAGVALHSCNTVMKNLEEKVALAEQCLGFMQRSI